jgi:SAM-dependent methyltransferase
LRLKTRSRLQKRYERLVKASNSEQAFSIPSSVQRYFNSAYGFEYVAGIRHLVGEAERVLIIGDGGGRDYYSLKLLGKRPVVMDIAAQSIIPDAVIADANLPLPFAPVSFQAVIMAEVLEHLPEDYAALRRIRDLVQGDGSLILTIPYYHDAEPTHVRIHSPASINRLLQAAGWETVEYIEKGGGLCQLAAWLPFRLSFHIANLIAFSFCRKTFYQRVNHYIAAFDFWLGRKRNSVHRWSRLYGAFIKCRKSSPLDCRAANVDAFENFHLKLVAERTSSA